jgi:hypothetical protein
MGKSRDWVLKWIEEFVTQPNAVFGNMPPCPYARQAILQDRVTIHELTHQEPDSNIWTRIENTNFDHKDVVVIVADKKRWTLNECHRVVEQLNQTFAHQDIIVMEDHPRQEESVKGVSLNNGRYCLLLIQRRSKLMSASRQLEKTDYYKNWSKKQLALVKGSRDQDPQ